MSGTQAVANPLADKLFSVSWSVGDGCSGTAVLAKTGSILNTTKQPTVLTAAHCVSNTKASDVIFITKALKNPSGVTIGHVSYNTKLVKRSKQLDLALLRPVYTPDNFVTADIKLVGDVDVLDTVFAVGTPFAAELENTITKGVVSAVNRELPPFPGVLFTQFDGGLYFGNSGGGLFDVYGNLVGVNTAIASSEATHLGFAVNVDLIKDFID